MHIIFNVFLKFIFQAIVINGIPLEKDISGCLKYPENVAKTMHPPPEVRTELFPWTQDYFCDATQPK